MDLAPFDLDEPEKPKFKLRGRQATVIYALIDPITSEARYVGKTGVGLNIRFSSHLRDTKPSWKSNWIRSLKKQGVEPRMEVLEEMAHDTALSDWQEAERFWISYLKSIGSRLTNYTDGGEGLRGHVFSEEHKRKIGNAHRGIKYSDESRAKMSEAWKHRSKDHIRKLSDAQRGKPLSPEHIKALGKAWLGKKHTPETKAKMSAAALGRKKSPETRARISAALLKRNSRNPH